MSTENNNRTPRLRFSGFTGEWEEKKLRDITEDIYQPQTISKEIFTNSGYPVYGANGIIGFYDKYNHDTDQILVTCRGASCGTINYSRGKCWITGNAMVINLDKVIVLHNKQFFYFLMENCDLSSIISGTGQPQIVRSPLLNLNILIPPTLAEQKKIAECLTEIDNLIAAQSDNVDALKEEKNGLMQQLFPQDGETTPRLRFPGFTGEWPDKKFASFTFAAGKKNKQNLPYERYSISNEMGFFPQANQFEGGGGYLKDVDCSMYIIVAPHSFAYNPARINVGSIGYQNLDKDVIVSSLYEVFKTKDDCDDTFLWHWFHTDSFRKMVHDIQEGGVRQYFYFDKLQRCSMRLPSLAEQQKIASCLSELDSLIAAESAELEALKDHKRGLMQQLFPQPDNK